MYIEAIGLCGYPASASGAFLWGAPSPFYVPKNSYFEKEKGKKSMLSKVLQDKIDNWNLEKEEIKKEIAELEGKKKTSVADAVRVALQKKSVDNVISARQAEKKHEEKLLALKSILQDVETTYPIDRELFLKEREAFIQHHRDLLDGKYDKIVEQIKELDRLFADYDSTYEAYVHEFADWIPVAKTFGLDNIASTQIIDETLEFEKFKMHVSYIMDDIKIYEMRANQSNND